MIFSILNQYKRLSWFIGIPSSILGILFLVRFFFLSRNESVPAPGVLLPNNPIHYAGIKSFSLKEIENELDSFKNVSRNQDEKKIVSLQIPKEDSMKINPLNNLREFNPHNSMLQSNNDLAYTTKKRNRAENEFYEPGLEEIRKYQFTENTHKHESINPEFNSYSKPEKAVEPKENSNHNFLKIRTKIVGDQTVTDGSEIQLRSMEDFEIQGITVAKNTLMNAEITIEEERIFCKINSIKMGKQEIETHFISQGLDKKMGIRTKDLSNNNKMAKSYLGETKNQVIHEMGQQLVSAVPLGSALVPNSLKSTSNSPKKAEFKLRDESEIYFITN